MKNRILTALALLTISFSVQAQKVNATVDRNEILIGEQIQLKLQANFNNNERPGFFIIDTIPRFDIIRKSAVDTQQLQEGIALSQEFVITSWDSGKIQLPAFTLDQWRTNPIPINVAYAPHPFDSAQPYHDIRDILEARKPIEEKWHWFVILALVLIGLFLLFFPKGRKKDKKAFVPDEGAYRKALKKLEALKKNENMDSKQFYTELIHVFREYLHRRKNIHSYSKTTGDIGLQLQQLQIDREAYSGILQTLRLSDMVKFAKYQPETPEKELSVHTIQQGIIIIEQKPNVV